MKGLLTILTFIVSNAAFANITVYDTIFFQNNTAWVSASLVCKANGNLYSTVTFETCGSNGAHSDTCGPVAFQMVQPMNSTAVRCASTGRECSKFETYPLNQGGVVNKYTYRTQIEASEGVNATITPYTIRNCSN